MESSLDQKRRELFEIHKAKLGTDAPLMRKPIAVMVAERKTEIERIPAIGPNKGKLALIGLIGTAVAAMALFLAKEAGWLD